MAVPLDSLRLEPHHQKTDPWLKVWNVQLCLSTSRFETRPKGTPTEVLGGWLFWLNYVVTWFASPGRDMEALSTNTHPYVCVLPMHLFCFAIPELYLYNKSENVSRVFSWVLWVTVVNYLTRVVWCGNPRSIALQSEGQVAHYL